MRAALSLLFPCFPDRPTRAQHAAQKAPLLAPPPVPAVVIPDDDPVPLRRLFSRGTVPEPPTEETEPQLRRLFSRGGIAEPHSDNEDTDVHLRRLFSRGGGGGLALIDEDRPSDGGETPVFRDDVSRPELSRLFSRGAVLQQPATPDTKRTTHSSTLDSSGYEEEVVAVLDSPMPSPQHKKLPVAPTPLGSVLVPPSVADDSAAATAATPVASSIVAPSIAAAAAAVAAAPAASAAPASLPVTFVAGPPRIVRQGSIEAIGTVAEAQLRLKEKQFGDLAARLPKIADQIVQESCVVDTPHHDDHTFSGIVFDVEARDLVPFEFIEIHSIAVRGYLGRVSIYMTQDTHRGRKHLDPSLWTRVYGPTMLQPSMQRLVDLHLTTPIRLAPTMRCGIYVHSEMPGDMAIVYDNQRHDVTLENRTIRIYPGLAHTSNVPFGVHNNWGGAWRSNREFVGRLRYGIRHLLWVPHAHYLFPPSYRRSVVTLLLCHRRPESPLFRVDKAVLFSIVNFIPLEWLTDAAADFPEEPNGPDDQVNRTEGSMGNIQFLRRIIGVAPPGVGFDRDDDDEDLEDDDDDDDDEDLEDDDDNEEEEEEGEENHHGVAE